MKQLHRITLQVLIGLAITLVFAWNVTACGIYETYRGRLTTKEGRAIAGAIVTASTDEAVWASARSNTFGYYTLSLPACEQTTYTVEPKHRVYEFEAFGVLVGVPVNERRKG
jgi:hypothetical protein